MPEETTKHQQSWIERFATAFTRAAGSNSAILMAFFGVIIWLCLGKIFRYSSDWKMIFNLTTSVVTFLMVFLIQKSQNKDYLAIQIKLNELLTRIESSKNRAVNIENLSEDELRRVEKYYSKLGDYNRSQSDLTESFSTEELEKLKEEQEDPILEKIHPDIVPPGHPL